MDRLHAMQVFVRVVERGSFSAVARESGTTQGAVSKQVAALERLLGARLLNRSTRALALTEEGERYFEQARRLVAEVAEAEGQVRRGARVLSGTLRVAAAVGFGRLKLLPLVQSFMAAHPAVTVDLRLSDGFIDIVEQGIDVAVRIGQLPDSSLIARRVGTTHRHLLAHRDLVRRMKRSGVALPASPEDLAGFDCIVYTGLASRNAWTFVADTTSGQPAGAARTVRVGGRLSTDSSEVVRAAVLAGMGLSYSPDWLFEHELERGEVLRLMPGWTAPPLPIQLVSPPQRLQIAKVAAFATWVADAFASADAAPPTTRRRRNVVR